MSDEKLFAEDYPQYGWEKESRVLDESYPKAVVATYFHEWHDTYIPRWVKSIPEEGILNLMVVGKGERVARNIASTMRLMDSYRDRVRVLTDWDIEKVKRGWLESDRAFFEENPRAGIIGHNPRCDYPHLGFVRSDWHPGMFLVFRPGMEVDWRLEEADCSRKGPIDLWLCFRAWEEGWEVYENAMFPILHNKESISKVVEHEPFNGIEDRGQQEVFMKFRARGWGWDRFPRATWRYSWDGSEESEMT